MMKPCSCCFDVMILTAALLAKHGSLSTTTQPLLITVWCLFDSVMKMISQYDHKCEYFYLFPWLFHPPPFVFLPLVFAFSNCCHHDDDDDDDDDFEDFREAPNFQFSTPHNQAPTTNHTPQTQFLLFLQFLLHLSLKTRQFLIQILSLGLLHITYFKPMPCSFGPLPFSKTDKHTEILFQSMWRILTEVEFVSAVSAGGSVKFLPAV